MQYFRFDEYPTSLEKTWLVRRERDHDNIMIDSEVAAHKPEAAPAATPRTQASYTQFTNIYGIFSP
jgi:hypothetical protein